MLNPDRLVAEHADLLRLAARILAEVQSDEPSAATTSALRWEMARKPAAHLAKEDRLLYPRLQASNDEGVSTRAKRFADEMGGLSAAYTRYMSDWSVDRITSEWPAFRQETMAVMCALGQRVGREEQELYPLLKEAQPR